MVVAIRLTPCEARQPPCAMARTCYVNRQVACATQQKYCAARQMSRAT
jgi:hypothetical protein